MKKVLAVFVLLAVATGAFAVSGKMYTRFNNKGPVFEYWAGAGNNVDLWQQKDGTGFDLNFDAFGITYKLRPTIAIPFGLEDNVFAAVYFDGTDWQTNTDAAGYDENYWGRKLVASSPGYIKIRDIKAGPVTMQVGFSWHQAFATTATWSTNTNGATNANGSVGLTFNKFYLDYKFDLPLGDMITIKQYDWDLMHFEYVFGDTKIGNHSQTSNAIRSGSSLLAYVPLNILVNLDPISLTISPLFVYDTTSTVKSGYFAQITNNEYVPGSLNFITNTSTMSSKMKVGGYARVGVGLLDFLSVYAMGGAYLTTTEDFEKETVVDVAAVATNSRSTSTSIAIPVFAGVVLNMGPGIKATVGWGVQYTTTTTVNDSDGTNLPGTTQTSWFNRYGAFDNNVKAEFATYGDNLMDLALLRFGSDAKFAGNWSVTIAAALGLNDEWTYPWFAKFQNGVTTSGIGTANVATSGANQLFSFINFMNYDRQMNIKYEDANVAIKGTIAQEGNFNGGANAFQTQLFGMFEYIDITIKF